MRKNVLFFCFLVLLSVMLSGCWSTHKKDGPPPYPVDVSKIPDAVPRAEPLSRIGNKPYTVFGKRYQVLHSRKNYVAVGIASWYGTQFHQRKTSNGERYNMLGMTAAHRTLPLPTYVQVTNLENSRHVIVKVNDRGPFEQNRLIDLSYAAAKKLGMTGRGTALVEIRALDPGIRKLRSTFLAAQRTRSFQGHILEVASFRHRAYAARLKQRLGKIFKYPPIYIKTMTYGQRIRYQVQIGPIKDQHSLAQIRKQLQAIGLASTGGDR